MTPGTPPNDHISTLTLHQLRYGELDRDQERALRAHVDACPRCRERLAGQEAYRHVFELQPVPPAIREAGERARRGSLWDRVSGWLGGRWALLPALAAAAVALVLVLPRGGTESTDVTRTKGAAEVVVLLEGHGRLEPDEAVHPGDRVQIEVGPGAWTHAWVTDGAQVIDDFDLTPQRATLAPFSLSIDAEPGDEMIVVVLSQKPLNEHQVARVLAAAEGGSEPGLPGVQVKRLELRKETMK